MEDCRLPNGMFECIVCGKQFVLKHTLKNHYTVHIKEKPFKCPKCPLKFNRSWYFRRHFIGAHIDRPMSKCSKCSFTTKHISVLKMHLLRCGQPVRKERCEVCFRWMSARSLEAHYMQHTGERPFRCGVCGKGFPIKASLKLHLKRMHLGRKQVSKRETSSAQLIPQQSGGSHPIEAPPAVNYTGRYCGGRADVDRAQLGNKCTVCNKVLGYGIKFFNHVKSHNPPVPLYTCRLPSGLYQCDVCGKQGMNKAAFASHYSVHTKERPFKCPQCPLALKTARTFTQHFRRIHTDMLRLKCATCDYTTKEKGILSQHLLRRHASKVRCEVCFKQIEPDRLESHYMLHTGERPFGCNECDARYTTKVDLYNHVTRKHRVIRQGTSKARGQCQRSAMRRGASAADLREDGFDLNSKIAANVGNKCIVCHETMEYGTNLLGHMKLHNPVVPSYVDIEGSRLPNGRYECIICGKQSRTKSDLRHHYQVSHIAEKPFKCPKCPYASTVSWSFWKHFKIVHLERPTLKCPKCTYTTKCKSALRIHLLRHSSKGGRERCEVCFKWINPYYLRSHYFLHTGEKPFRCNECGQQYVTKAYLNRHIRVVHIDRKRADKKYVTLSRVPGTSDVLAKLGNRCVVCNEVQGPGTYFLGHMKSHDPVVPEEDCCIGNQLYKCDVCGMEIQQRNRFHTHYMQHIEERPFKCPRCPTAVKTSNSFVAHFINVHLPRPLMKCLKCPFTTKYCTSMRLHHLKH